MAPLTPLHHASPSPQSGPTPRWDIGATAAVLRKNSQSFKLETAALWALIAHATLVLLIFLTIFLLDLLGIKINPFQPLAMKERDVEFVLVNNPTQQPRNKHTKNRADHATRSGGQKVANKPQAEPQRAAGHVSPKPQPSHPASKPNRTVAQARPQVTPTPRAVQAPAPKAPPTPHPQPQAPAPKAPVPKIPHSEVAMAQPKLPPNPIAPAIKMPAIGNPKPVATGPVATSSASSGGSSSGGGRGIPGPQAIPGSLSRNLASGSPGSGSRGYAGGGGGGSGPYNQSGSPGGGGGRPGIDALPEPDFGPYIAELQRRIKRNWQPPTADRSKRVVALFTIGRNGQLISSRIQTSSGSGPADQAAMAAIAASAPFRNLPSNFRGNSIDVQFIFDYDVYQSAKMR